MLIEATSRPADNHGPRQLPTGNNFGFTPRRSAELAVGAFLAGYGNANTRDAYRIDMTMFLRWCDDMRIADPIRDITRGHIEVYMRHLEEQAKAPATMSRRLTTINVFYEWCVDHEPEPLIERNPCRKVRKPVVSKVSSTPWLNTRELERFLAAGEELGGYDAVTALILGLNGLRVSELTGSNVEDLTEQNYHRVLRIMGKGQKPADVPLPPRTLHAIDKALDGRTRGPLVLSRTGGRATRETIARTVERVCAQANITKRVTPHGVRHAIVTALLQQGTAFREVQIFARHENPATTMRYDRARESLDKHAAYLAGMVFAP